MDREALLLPRRSVLALGLSAALGALVRPLVARAEDPPGNAKGAAASKAVIVLWLRGGPSQLETFDPKPGTRIGGPTRAIATRAKGVLLAHHYPRLAEEMRNVALIRSVVTPEGEHERGSYILRTGYRPQPTVVHPAFGAVVASELAPPDQDLPAHVALLDPQPPKAGLLGPRWDAFATGDPKDALPDLVPRVDEARAAKRHEDLAVVERALAGRSPGDAREAGHHELAERARRLMGSSAIRAFRTEEEPLERRRSYGETPFGRGCLAARRLVERGARCVEVVLDGWDSHADNFPAHERLGAVLDPALASLLADLRERDLLRRTLVVVTGEFGRTPRVNVREGRDHWPHGFSVLLAGAGIRGGAVVGETDPEGGERPKDSVSPGDLFATLYAALGLDPEKKNTSPAGRPIALADGKVVSRLLA